MMAVKSAIIYQQVKMKMLHQVDFGRFVSGNKT